MKTEREIYLKPLTLREQVAMEQGICSASIYETKRIEARGHEVGGEFSFSVGFDTEGNQTVTGTNNGVSGGVSWE